MQSFLYRYVQLLFFFLPLLSTAQNSQLRAYSSEDGLPQSEVFDIIQDDKGYLWIGTQGGGLCRFDGDEIKVWNENQGLPSNYINALLYQADTLFIGTKRGLSLKTKSSFYHVEGPRINKIFTIKNTLYLSSTIGLYTYNKSNGIQKVPLHPKINTSSIKDIVYDGKLYWIATDKGLWKLNSLQQNASIIDLHSPYHFTTARMHQHILYAAVANTGILRINTRGKSYENIWIRHRNIRINQLSFQKENELWMATDNAGIIILDLYNYHIKEKINRRKGLAVSHIKKTFTDTHDNIWIATVGGGFYKYFTNNFIHYNKNNGLKGNRVYAVHHIKNNIWASNSEAGLVQIDSSGVTHFEQHPSLSDVRIKTITHDSKGSLWAGTEGKGILYRRFSYRDSIVIDSSIATLPSIDTIRKKVSTDYVIDKATYKKLPSDWIKVLNAHKNTIWAASYSSGIFKFQFDPDQKKIQELTVFRKKQGIKDLLINDMKTDSLGRVWYSTQNGHLGYILNNNVFHFDSIIKQKTSIRSILFHKGIIYIGTAGKGIWAAKMTDKPYFTQLKGVKKLYSNNIYQIIFDNEGYLWAGSESGVDKISLDKKGAILDVFHYGRNDGFLGIETCLNAATKDDDGNLWFGAIYGLTKYKPSTIEKRSHAPSIYFENIEVSYKSIDSINLNQWVQEEKVLQLTPEQTELSFDYITVDIDHPQDIEYRFKLNNSEWSDWSTDSKQNLAGLAYGPHTFTAQSRNYRWQESNPISFHFFIDSPIYEKVWFQWSMVGLSIFLLLVITASYIRRVKRAGKIERERLELKNHLLSLEQKALRLQMNPHFIFNVLNGIKAMGTRDPERMNTTINTFAVLLRETLYNSRKDYISLDQEIKTIKHYIEIEQLMSSKLFTYEINTDTEHDTEEILIPPMLIQPFVENAIRHGILKAIYPGHLKISFHTSEDFLYCSVLDNGVGIFQSQKSKTSTDHQSMALTVTEERLVSISGKDALKISEIIDDDQTVKGTQIQFKIPLETEY